MQHPHLHIHVVVSEPFAENTYIAHLPQSDRCVVVDPGLQPGRIAELLHAHRLTPAAILNTHGHADHIAGNAYMKQHWPQCPLVIGRGDAGKLLDPWANLSAPFGLAVTSPPADVLVEEPETVEAAGMVLHVLETPGHSAGHVVFVWQDQRPPVVFGGDVLFRGSVGRVDFPDSDAQQLVRSIREKLFALPDETIVLPGHGEPTTIGHEKRFNPLVGLHVQTPLF